MKTFSALMGAALLALAMMMGGATGASAQTISQTGAISNAGSLQTGQGQSFTATATGTVTQIRVRSRSANATTLRIYNGAVGSGTAGVSAGSIYSQAVTLTDSGSNAAGFTTITLSTPVSITAGSQYTFTMDASDLAFAANVYAGGTLINNFGLTSAGADAAFEVVQVAGPLPVPTLSEWAMILFGTLLAGGAALYIQRRRMIA